MRLEKSVSSPPDSIRRCALASASVIGSTAGGVVRNEGHGRARWRMWTKERGRSGGTCGGEPETGRRVEVAALDPCDRGQREEFR